MKGSELNKEIEKTQNILEIKNISKNFGAVKALDDVSMELRRGEVMAVVGDNGAGKSTLIKIISGVLKKDSGEIYFNGEKVEIKNPTDSRRLGIETVYQDLALIDIFDVTQNIFLGRELTYDNLYGKTLKAINYRRMRSEVIALFKKYNIKISDHTKPMFNYSGGQRQAVSLSKAAYWGSKLIILDEPTAALGVKESKNALNLIKILNDHGISIIVISHNMQHVFEVVDRIFVLRQGKNVAVKDVHETTFDEIVSLITGSKIIESL
jgi:fructose transport system ATP-binding protein